jgi:hypothetical protein
VISIGFSLLYINNFIISWKDLRFFFFKTPRLAIGSTQPPVQGTSNVCPGGWSGQGLTKSLNIKICKTPTLYFLDISMNMVSHTVEKRLIQVLKNWVEYLDVSDGNCEEK